jgi:hypothetical protein
MTVLYRTVAQLGARKGMEAQTAPWRVREGDGIGSKKMTRGRLAAVLRSTGLHSARKVPR